MATIGMSVLVLWFFWSAGIFPFNGLPRANARLPLARYNRRVQRSRYAISVTDIEGRFVSVNDKKVRYLGLSRQREVLGHFPWDFAPPSQPTDEVSFVAGMKQINFAREGEQPVFDWVLNDRHGQQFTIQVALQPIELAEGTYVRAVAKPKRAD